MNIGAADVHLQPAHLRLFVQLFAGVGVIGNGKAGHIGHYRLVENFLQFRKLPGNHRLHPGILQAHGVDHTGGALGDPGGGVSEPGILGGSLEGEGAKLVDVVKLGVLVAVAEGAGGGNHGIGKFNAAQIYAQASHKISSFRMTGPSLQIRL